MPKEDIRQEFRPKNFDERSNYLVEEIHQNELMSMKHRKFVEFCNRIKNPCNNCRN